MSNLDDFAREISTTAQTDQLMAAVESMAGLLSAYYHALTMRGFGHEAALDIVRGYQTAILTKKTGGA